MKKILVIALIAIFSISTHAYGFEPVLPGQEIGQPDGNSADNLNSSQDEKESTIDLMQAIEDASQTQAAASSFVTVNGTDLSMNGLQYKFALANQYYLFYKSTAMIDEVFSDAASLGLNVIRTWGFCDGGYKEGVSFQPSLGVYDESGFAKMDYIIYKASQMNMKVILPFVNNWDDFGGINQYVAWYLGRTPSQTEHDLFFTNDTIKGWYKSYVTQFVNRVNSYSGIAYKDDPAILAWELANEPRAYTDTTGTILNPWVDEMAAYLKSIDSKHLLSAGVEGWNGYTNTGTDFIATQSSPNIDLATFHLFPDYYGLTSDQALQWVRDRASAAQSVLKKPVYIGEFGKMVDRDASNATKQMSDRNTFYKNVYSAASNAGVDGAGFWLLSGHQDDGSLYPDYDHFTVYAPEDSATVRAIKTGAGLFKPATPPKGKGGKAASQITASSSFSSISSDPTRMMKAFSRRRASLSKSWLQLFNETSQIPEMVNTELPVQ